VLLWIDLYPTSSPSLLKKEGIISLSRYVQYAGCVFFAWTIHARLKGMPLRKRLRFFSIIDTQMFWCGLILSTFWLLTYAGIQTGFTYLDEHRLNGGYVEGGPFGLFYAFFFLFRVALLGFSRRWLVLLAIILLASQSKAGIIFLLASSALLYFPLTQKSKSLRFILPIAFAAMLVGGDLLFDFSGRIHAYRASVASPEDELPFRLEDKSFTMGRIAGTYISPRMFQDHPLLGVGMGNYSLTRNDPRYRGPFPYVDDWDLTGLGGIVSYVLEGGLLGLAVFFLPFLDYWLRNKKKRRTASAVFLMFFVCQVFGVQLYFQYIWLPLAALTAIDPENWSIANLRRRIPARAEFQGACGENINEGIESTKNAAFTC
jgi:hypothetical protein